MPSRAYDVVVGRGCLAGLGGALARRCPGGKTVVCCDENVAPLYLEQARSSLRAAGYEVSHIVIPAGEAQKNLARAEELYGVLYARGVRRVDPVLGGGELRNRVERLAGGPLTAARVSQELVAGCVERKVAVVAGDEREETGARAVLNLGHTIGHAVEAATGFSRYTHGAAVGLGLRASLWLSRRLCGLDPREEARGQALLDGLGLPRRLEAVPAKAVCDLTRRDKKAGRDGVGYVLLDAPGSPRLDVRVPPELEREVVEWLMQR